MKFCSANTRLWVYHRSSLSIIETELSRDTTSSLKVECKETGEGRTKEFAKFNSTIIQHRFVSANAPHVRVQIQLICPMARNRTLLYDITINCDLLCNPVISSCAYIAI